MKKLLILLVLLSLYSCGDDIKGYIIVEGVEKNTNVDTQGFKYRVTLDGELVGRNTNFYTNTNYKVGDTIK